MTVSLSIATHNLSPTDRLCVLNDNAKGQQVCNRIAPTVLGIPAGKRDRAPEGALRKFNGRT